MSKQQVVVLLSLAGVAVVAVLLWWLPRAAEGENLQKAALNADVPVAQRERAVLDLGSAGKESIPRVREVLSQAREPQVRAAAIMSLTQLRDWESMPTLLNLLDDPEEMVRNRAGMGVSRMLGRDYGYKASDSKTDRAKAVRLMRDGYLKVGNAKPFYN